MTWAALPSALRHAMKDFLCARTNWGTHQLMLRLPRRLLDVQVAERYSTDEGLTARAAGDAVIVEFLSEDEEGGGWVTDEESAEWLPALLPLRSELADGDLRCLYLGWLMSAQGGMLDDDAVEPPVPPGLASLSAALTSLVEFLGIDGDLIAVAAERSAPLRNRTLSDSDLQAWIGGLAGAEKDALLLRLLREDGRQLRKELLRRARQVMAPAADLKPDGGIDRTVTQLVAAGEQRAEARKRAEAAQQAEERARRQREQAAAREHYLAGMAGRAPELWQQVETLIDTKRPADYDQAVQLLVDLRDLAARSGQPDAFACQLRDLRGRHSKKSTFMQRLDRAGLRA